MKPRIVGSVALVAVAAAILPAVAALPGSETLAERAFDHVRGAATRVTATFDAPSGLVVGDPALRISADALAHVGTVEAVAAAAGGGETVTLRLDGFEARRLGADSVVRALHPGSNLGWALATLTPSDLRDRVMRDLGAAWDREGEAALSEAVPALREGLTRLLDAALLALPAAVERERPQWEPVAARLRAEIVDGELAPALDAELWPRVRQECGAVAGPLADELVKELGVGALAAAAWARTKDAVGIGNEKAFAREIERLAVEKAIPVVRRHVPALLDAAGRAGRDAWAQPPFRAAVERAVERALADPQARESLVRVLRAAFVEDPRVVAAWRSLAEDARLRRAVERVAKAAEPVFESALREALLREDGQGLDLRLVRVLRNVLLWKDRRYALIESAGAAGTSPSALRGVR